MSDGKKFDLLKLRYELTTPVANRALAAAVTYGAWKYGPGNWRDVQNAKARYYGALMRHIEADRNGEFLDSESGLPHVAHALASLHFLATLRLEETQMTSVDSFDRAIANIAKMYESPENE